MDIDGALLVPIMDHFFEGIYVVDQHRRILLWNRGAELITGFRRQDVVGTPCYDNKLEHSDETGCVLCHTACPLQRTLEEGSVQEERVFVHHRDGHRIPAVVRNVAIRNGANEIVAAAQLFRDLSLEEERLQRIRELEALSRTDPLTRLPNRVELEATTRRRLEELRRYGTPVATALMDVDHFKQINDTHGHTAGDQALRAVGETLRHNLRSVDTVGRWGGDEFLAVFANVDPIRLHTLLERVRALAAASQVSLGAGRLGVTLSIGATMATPRDSYESLLSRADGLLYQSKKAGRNRVTIG